MSFFSWLQNRTSIQSPRLRARKPHSQPARRGPRLTLEQLETRLRALITQWRVHRVAAEEVYPSPRSETK